MILSSSQNPKIKLVSRLRSKRGRQRHKRFLIDYSRDLQRALACGYAVDYVLTCPDIAELQLDAHIEAHQVSPELMAKLSYRENPSGLIAVMRSREARGLGELRRAAIRDALLLVDLRVPGNIGALLRTADAAGMDAVILVDCALDLYNPNIIRSSTGACFLDSIYQLSGDEALAWLNETGIRLICAEVQGARSLYKLDFGDSAAIALGAEDRGLTQRWLKRADQRVRIPMAGRMSDSLNVSVSGAILIYELYRQRHHS